MSGVFDAGREDWITDLEYREAEVSGRVVIDELVTPGRDPHELPESLPCALFGWLMILFTAVSLVLLGATLCYQP